MNNHSYSWKCSNNNSYTVILLAKCKYNLKQLISILLECNGLYNIVITTAQKSIYHYLWLSDLPNSAEEKWDVFQNMLPGPFE